MSASTTSRSLVTRSLGGLGGVGLAGWIVVTGLSQHPNRSFDLFRRYDPSGILIPNWRFFAPNPAVHDNRLAHRILWDDDSTSSWIETHHIEERTWRDGVWCPGRRRDKAVTDMCSSLLTLLAEKRVRAIEHTPTYRSMSSIVRHQVAAHPDADRGVRGYQFVVCRDPGYDEDDDVQLIFASRFEPWVADLPRAVSA